MFTGNMSWHNQVTQFNQLPITTHTDEKRRKANKKNEKEKKMMTTKKKN